MTQVEAAKKELIEHYVSMCGVSDAWKAQAWRSANDLAKLYPECFGDLPGMLTEAMKEKSDAAAS